MEINRCELLTAVALLDGRFLSTKCCSVCRKPHVDVDGRARARARALLLLLPRNKTTEDGRKDGKRRGDIFIHARARARTHTHTHIMTL